MNRIITPKKIGIYKITNLINGMVYIGQSRDIYCRWSQHKHGRNKDHNYYLGNAISKYGIENFYFEIIEECLIEDMDRLETEYIKKFNSLKPNGYNLELGGNSNKEITEDTKKRMSLSSRNRWTKPITKQEIKNRSIAHQKKVSKYSKSGEYIETYDSLIEAGIKNNIPPANITVCCKKQIKSAGGFIWRYGCNKNVEPFIDGRSNNRRNIRVSQFTLDGKFISNYKSLNEASLLVGASISCISMCLSGRKNRKTAAGFIWRYTNDSY